MLHIYFERSHKFYTYTNKHLKKFTLLHRTPIKLLSWVIIALTNTSVRNNALVWISVYKPPRGPLYRYTAYELQDTRELSKTFAVNSVEDIAPLKAIL